MCGERFGNPGRGRVQDQGRDLGLLDQRHARDDVGREHEAGEQVDLLAHDQFLHGGLGGVAARILGVALDQLDRVRAELGLALERQVEVHAALDLLAEVGAAAGIVQHDADLDGPGGRRCCRRESQREAANACRHKMHCRLPHAAAAWFGCDVP